MSSPKIFIIGSPLLTISLIILISLISLKTLTYSYQELPGEETPIMPPRKISPDQKHPPYLTNPPTSGWFTETDIRDGIFQNPLKDEQIVYSLLQGKVVLNYNCSYSPISPAPQSPQLPQYPQSPQIPQQSLQEAQAIWQQVEGQNKKCGDIISNLRQIVDEKGTKDIILAPKSNLDARIALSAWGRLDKMLWVDKKRIIRFINAYRGKVPNIIK